MLEKTYNINRGRNYIKKNNLFFLTCGITQSSYEQIKISQMFKSTELTSQKVVNKFIKRTLSNSIYNKLNTSIKGPVFFIKSNNKNILIKKNLFLNYFEPFFLNLLIIKLNNRIYSFENFNNLECFTYKQSSLLFYKFRITNLKNYCKFFEESRI